MPPAQGTRVRPIQRFAEAAAKCVPEGRAYGQCIMVDYNNVYKDKCLTEFLRFKECYLVRFCSVYLSPQPLIENIGACKEKIGVQCSRESFYKRRPRFHDLQAKLQPF